jgi:DNA transposition AAA+ family ATPase
MSSSGPPFLITGEYRRFAEFCDACRQYRYIGLCYGPAGVGKTLSARHYAAWDRFEELPSVWYADDTALAAFDGADTVLYTPHIVNSPRSVADDVRRRISRVSDCAGIPACGDSSAVNFGSSARRSGIPRSTTTRRPMATR